MCASQRRLHSCSFESYGGIAGHFDQAVILTIFFFFFHSSMLWSDDHKKNDLHEFSDFFENFSGSNGRNRREIRAVIDSFETYIIYKFFDEKKIFETNSIMSRASFWVAQPK